jgi:pimeloyl-ACP methyl ester carboxylesterase
MRLFSWRVLIALALAVALAACVDESPVPTATPDWPTPLPPIPASPTVNPVAPIEEGPEIRDPASGVAGASNATQAALAAEGEPGQIQPTITPLPTQAQLPMMVGASDGLILRGTFYGPAIRPAPAVLIVRRNEFAAWDALTASLQAAGYAVLVMDLRGFGATGGAAHWPLALEDARAALAQLADLPGVNPGQIIVIGDGIGANLVFNACADYAGCAGAALLSPGLDYLGITTAGAMARFGRRAVLIIASENDDNNPADSVTLNGLAGGDHMLAILPSAGHGATLFAADPGLPALIAGWIQARFPPPTIAPTATSES